MSGRVLGRTTPIVLLSLTRRRTVMLFAPAEPLYNRRASRYLRGLIRKALREVIVILSHHVEHGLPGPPTMIVGKHLVQVGQLLVGHGIDLFGKMTNSSRDTITGVK